MATGNYITSKAQQAIQAYLRTLTFSGLPSAQIYSGIERDAVITSETEEATRVFPCCDCVCQSATVSDRDGLNWLAIAEVTIRNNADDTTEATHHTMAEAVVNALTTDEAAINLSAALVDFTAFLVSFTDQSWGIEERSWVSRLTFEIHCCGSDIS